MEKWMIALVSTLSGTLLGWLLQFVKRRRLIFSKIKIKPTKPKQGFCNAYFTLNLHNTSSNTRAIRNPKITCYSNRKNLFEEEVQEAKAYTTPEEKEEGEKFRTDIDLIEVQPHGNIAQYCKIEFFDFDDKVTKAYLTYKTENFKEKRIKISWINRTDTAQGDNK